ncbi:unnamed protein product [Cylicocyclus nassatus]|uniref:Uncharacterized protein n=1 Tax=Cylicocyclus nassatus TaxID=53992 RepID=A0AA36HD83_CYLNA|nr:unnamed protein product [Cylicocyclus nassatus]
MMRAVATQLIAEGVRVDNMKIGVGTAVLFAKEGAKVTITGKKQDGLEAMKAMIKVGANEDDVIVVVADVTDAIGKEQIVSSTVEIRTFRHFGLNAGTDILEKTMKINVYSVVDMIKLARSHLIKSKGEIINVSSTAGQPSSYAMTAYYAMSKAALDQKMRAMAIELIAEGVRVNSVRIFQPWCPYFSFRIPRLSL